MLCRQLSFEWGSNEQYAYGWFVPFFAAFLFWRRYEESQKDEGERKKEGSTRESVSGEVDSGSRSGHFFLLTSSLLFLLLPVRLFEVANPDWRPLSWIHALLVVGYSLLVIGYWGGKPALTHFAFPVCFILLAVPWITPIEGPLVRGLMRLVAAVTTEAANLFGIPAQLEGSVIRTANGAVGVSDACSGVRSLQTSLMIGLLFGELKGLTISGRIALVAAALTIALLANFGRAFFLVWIAATQNLAAVERWHDLAGYAILGAVFLGTLAIASSLTTKPLEGRASARPRPAEASPSGLRPLISTLRRLPLSFCLLPFAFFLLTESAVSIWYGWHERNFIPTTAWTVQWPENAPGFRELPIAENIRSTLRYDRGCEAVWRMDFSPNDSRALPVSCTMFFFRWEPGSASILRARAHRPDICLPPAGWRLRSDSGVRDYDTGNGITLPFRHFRFVRRAEHEGALFAEAFFCQREDRVPARAPDQFDATAGHTGNWLRDDRVRVVLQGVRNQGQQVMEMVFIAARDVGKAEAEERFAQIVRQVVQRKK